ncbi:hypothetical protein M885DRAFT_558078 [Pelagophyceae sp. CCMP2097]|nr:hypothetical protein M885DRAFT_558078 [Pelagophyceae sp. CCMP2097]
MLVNQKDGIGQTLLESKFVTGDSISRRTRALKALVGRACGAGSVASLDVAKRLGDGWTAMSLEEGLGSPDGLLRISDVLSSSRGEAGVFSTIIAEATAAHGLALDAGGLLRARVGWSEKAPGSRGAADVSDGPDGPDGHARRSRKKPRGTVVRLTIFVFTEEWERTYSKTHTPAAHRMLVAKYLAIPDWAAARLRDDDDSICEGVKWGETHEEWEVSVRRNDTRELDTLMRLGSGAPYVANALHEQPDGLEPQFYEVDIDGDDDVPTSPVPQTGQQDPWRRPRELETKCTVKVSIVCEAVGE